MIRGTLALASLSVPLALAACDDSQVAHRMSPGWERMQTQARGESYGESAFFADHRAMRTPPPGTLPMSALEEDDACDGGGDRSLASMSVDVQMIARGRESFETVCATCHGIAGDGDSVVASKMQERRPPSLHEPRIVHLSDAQIARIVREGYGFMPSFAAMLAANERWAIIAYVRALQASRTNVAALPEDARHALDSTLGETPSPSGGTP
jgi:mono/diheme cytochrome c family protein